MSNTIGTIRMDTEGLASEMDKVGAGFSHLQDQLVARLYQGQATSFNLPAGKLSIRMGMLGGIGCIPAFEQIRGEHIELKAGEVRKYRIALGNNGLYLIKVPSAQ